MGPERGHRHLGQGKRPARFLGLGIPVRPDRSPHSRAGRHGRVGRRIAEVDVFPAQRPGLFGADAGREAQGDICVHPGVLSGGQECRCLFQAEALARPSGLALGGFDEQGDVAPDEIAGFGVPDRPGQRVVAHDHGRTRVAQCHRRQRLVHVSGGQLAQPPGADGGQDRGEDVLVFLDGLGRPATEAFGQPVFSRVADGIARAGLDACVEVAVQRLQPVLDDRFGFAGDLAPDSLPVRAEAEADHAPPPARAVPVPVAVPARAVVLEEDPVLAPAASCAHGLMVAGAGANLGGHLPASYGLTQLCPAIYLQLARYNKVLGARSMCR